MSAQVAAHAGEFLLEGDPAALLMWPDWPLYALDYPALREQARASLARREEAYPEWIRRARIDADEAAADIAGWRLILAEWTWIVDGTGDPPPVGTLAQRRAAVDLSIERIDAEMRRGARGHDVLRQSHLLQALRWHLHRIDHGEPRIHRLVRVNRALRADLAAAAQPERSAA